MHHEAFTDIRHSEESYYGNLGQLCNQLFALHPWRTERRNQPFPIDTIALPIRIPVNDQGEAVLGEFGTAKYQQKLAQLEIARIVSEIPHNHYGISIRFNDKSPVILHSPTSSTAGGDPQMQPTEIVTVTYRKNKKPYTAVSCFNGDEKVDLPIKGRIVSYLEVGLKIALENKTNGVRNPRSRRMLRQKLGL